MKNFESQSCKRVASLVLQKGLEWVLHGPAKGLPDCLCFTALEKATACGTTFWQL